MISSNRRAWSRFVALGAPLFRSEARWKAFFLLGLLIVLLLSITALNILNSYIGREFMTAVAQREASRLYRFALLYAGGFAVTTMVAVSYRFTEERLGLFWRQWLTQHVMQCYLSRHAYYWLTGRVDVDNPDQRMTEDIRTFTATTLSLFLILLNALITLLAFSGILWSITPWLVIAAVVYAGLGSLLTIGLGYRLVRLNFLQLKKEADLRYELLRLREYAESIALLHGEARESTRLQGRLAAVVENFQRIIAINRNLGFFTTGYNYMTQLLPVLIVVPLYVRGSIEFGVVTQAAMAFTFVLGAFSLIVTEFQRISSFAAVIARLGALEEAIAATPVAAGPELAIIESEDRVAYEHLTLLTPQDERVLIRDLCLEIPSGQRLVILGPNRIGKSVLVHATAGLWTTGHGRIVRPPPYDVMFLPQRPYTTYGSLRHQLVYACAKNNLTDDTILAVLRAVQFEPVLQRVGGLAAEGDWGTVLSTSEQQVLTVAQLLLASPRFAFLDEAVSALDPENRHQIYTVLSQTPITYISISNDPMLLPFHDRVLELGADGAWSVRAAMTATRP